jgi:zinc protease
MALVMNEVQRIYMINRVLTLTCGILLCSGVLADDDLLDLEIDIPYEVFKLENGLTVIVHEDHKAPIVAVNVWYHVGSKDEVRGKTGFAHLFEHLMFNGSENHNKDYFKATEKLGATGLNGTTNVDRTNYFQTVPTSALDAILWLESDRMGNLLGAITQQKLNEQRSVVQNEKRQRVDNAPFGKGSEIQYSSIYPHEHPYSWTTIGSMSDLNAATLDDVRRWFKTYYGAANAVLSIAGDVTIDEVQAKVEYYFGDIDPGPPLTKHKSWINKLTGTQKEISYDRVPQTMLLKSWNIGGAYTKDSNLLDMVATILSNGKSSRLYKRLVYDEQLVSSVNAYTAGREIAGTFEITAMILPGVAEEKVDAILDEEMAKFLKTGPTRHELEQVRIQLISGFVKGLEQIGGFGGKSDILATYQVFTGNPGYFRTELDWIKNATRRELRDVSQKWLSDGLYQLEIRPFPRLAAQPPLADRSQLPEPGEPPLASFDQFERAQLENGLQVILAQRHSIPVVHLQLSVDAGFASDQFSRAGVAKLAMNMLDEGTTSLDALQISDQLISLGASLGTGSNLDVSSVNMTTLATKLDQALKLFADVAQNPSFPDKELERLRTQQLTSIQREQSTPTLMAGRLFPQLIYGTDHAYSNPISGSGTIDSTRRITMEELKAFHETWFKANHATMIVVGDTTMEEVLPQLEAHFGDWQTGDVPAKNVAHIDRREQVAVYLVDRPGAPQSLLMAGIIATPKANPMEIATESMNDILGGTFTSRINMNLREDKGWSYGASTALIPARGQRTFYMMTGVQADKTADAIKEVMKEFKAFLTDNPATDEEVRKTVINNTLTLSGQWETSNAVLATLSQLVRYNLPDDYFNTYPDAVKALTTDAVRQAAKSIVAPEGFIWVVVGDRRQVEASLSDLGYGDPIIIDPDGNRLEY